MGLGFKGLGFRVYLDPIKPSFLGFPIMISFYNIEKSGLFGAKVGFKSPFPFL